MYMRLTGLTSLFCIFCKKNFLGVLAYVNAAPPPRRDGGAGGWPAGRLAGLAGLAGLARVNPVRVYPWLRLIVKPVYRLDIRHVDYDALAQCVKGDVA